MKITGKYTFTKKNKNNQIVDKFEKHNVITKFGRKRILEILSHDFPKNTYDGMVGIKPIELKNFYIQPVFSNNDICIYDGSFDSSSNVINSIVVDSSLKWLVTNTFKKSNNKLNGTSQYKHPYKKDTYIDFNQCRNNITNNGYNDNVDDILKQSNRAVVTWLTNNSYSSFPINKNWHNIDINVVRCKQQVKVSIGYNTIEIWGGLLRNGEKLDIVYNKDSFIIDNHISSTNIQIIDDNKIKFYSTDNFTSILRYDAHILTEQIKNGICGIQLNYYHNNLQNHTFDDGFMFGNGSFSSNGGSDWDEYIALPWSGRPIEKQTISEINKNNSFSIDQTNDISSNKHNFIFCPYVFKNATNFSFYFHLPQNSSIDIQNFLFYTYQFLPQTPQALALGNGINQPNIDDVQLGNEVLKTDVISWNIDENGTLKWKAYIDFDEGNGVNFTQVGLYYSDSFTYSDESGWTYFAPITKDKCDKLFSRTVLDESFSKTDDESLEVVYELTITA